MTWNVNVRGFLPPQDPLETLATTRLEYMALTGVLENLSITLPYLVEERRIREEVVYQLRQIVNHFDPAFIFSGADEYTERSMLIYSYMASAYVYARHESPANRIPKEIAIPLVRLAKQVGRHPILSYASYCLTNWRRIDPNKPIELGNIELLQNFCTKEVGKSDEEWFILVHVDIEAKAGYVIHAIDQITRLENIDQITRLEDKVSSLFGGLLLSLQGMNDTLNRMPEGCSPDNYYRWVRPYIFSFKDVVYEGCFDNQPQTFRGETGAQSSIIPALISVLGIKHEDTLLTQHLTEMREYMPPKHQLFLRKLEHHNNNLRIIAQNRPEFRNLYNECVQQLLTFRAKHFEYAVNYIAKKVDNPQGTGGTPYIPWLQQLKDETNAHLLTT